MIDSLIAAEVRQRLAFYPAVAILGPRQVGKTTLAGAIAAEHPGALFMDLERESDRAVLADTERLGPAPLFAVISAAPAQV